MKYKFTLRAARGYSCLSGEEAAAALHVSTSKLYRLETGKDMPDAAMILEIAGLYGIDPRDLVLKGITEASRKGAK